MVPEPDPDAQQRRLAELASWHAEWVAKHEATTPFRPDDSSPDDSSPDDSSPDDSSPDDYALHHVDLEASQEAQDEFMMRAREIMGLDPVTGLPIEGR